jgi:hypothetical protein
MVNGVGANIGENAAAHAVARGYYLQSNNHRNTASTRAILAAYDGSTKIIVEAENGGCRTATLDEGFEAQMRETFSFGYAIDYLMLCYETFADGETARTLPSVAAELRGGAPAPATATARPASPTATSRPAGPTPTPTARPWWWDWWR